MRNLSRHGVFGVLIGAILTAVVGCGGGGSGDAGRTAATAAPVPTMPPARFTAVAQQSITRTATITTTATLTTAAMTATQSSASEAPAVTVDLERGARAYERNKCGDCHGAQGEGVAGQGKAIAGTSLSEAEFTSILRTGGGLGNTHIFGPQAVSPAGMSILYAYVQSLE